MPVEQPLRIAVCGGGIATAEECALAEAVGRGIAAAGAVLICGGRGGIMEAAARGATAAGGLTVGLLPGTRAGEANPYISLPLATGMGEGRNILVVRAAEAVIAVAGEWGTLSEVALARKIDVPVVLLRAGLAAGLGLEQAETPEDAVQRALEHARARRAAAAPALQRAAP
ncbi:MAG: TIGR00725 family protein [Gemmatimonadetes bacterium]|nr:TIGR00725 family protein [Gemmatimonadota bacterium]